MASCERRHTTITSLLRKRVSQIIGVVTNEAILQLPSLFPSHTYGQNLVRRCAGSVTKTEYSLHPPIATTNTGNMTGPKHGVRYVSFMDFCWRESDWGAAIARPNNLIGTLAWSTSPILALFDASSFGSLCALEKTLKDLRLALPLWGQMIGDAGLTSLLHPLLSYRFDLQLPYMQRIGG